MANRRHGGKVTVMPTNAHEDLLANLVDLAGPFTLCSVVDGPSLPEMDEDRDEAIARLADEAEEREEDRPKRFLTIITEDHTSGDVSTAYHDTIDEALTHLGSAAETGSEPTALLDLAAGIKLPIEQRTVVEVKGLVPVDVVVRTIEGRDVACLPVRARTESEWLDDEILNALVAIGRQAPERSVLWLRLGDVWLHPMDARLALSKRRVENTAGMYGYVASYGAIAVRDKHRLPPWHVDHMGFDTDAGNGAAAALVQRVLARTIEGKLTPEQAERVLEAESAEVDRYHEISSVERDTISERLRQRGWPDQLRHQIKR